VRWLILLFVVVPLVELYLLLQLAVLIDFWPTVALVLVTGIVGGVLAKMEGLRVLRAWRHAFETMTPPEAGVLDGVLVLVGGALLVTPGVLTDLAGLLMLVPFSRRLIAARLRSVVDRAIAARQIRVATTPLRTPSFGDDARHHPVTGPDVVETTGEGVAED
jgi:UPF0716 protein FxsA